MAAVMRKPPWSRLCGGVLSVSLLLPLPLPAQTRAWLSRDAIAFGQTTTLNIETEQASVDAPDYTPLHAQFDVSDRSSRHEYRLLDGKAAQRVLFAVALRPRQPGVLQIPPLQVGRQRTPALTLHVGDRAAASAVAQAGAEVFVEAELDARRPYVQQAVVYTARLHYATPIRGGVLQPEPAQMDGASLRQVGEDVQYSREIDGRHYRVLERRYLLIPERSGRLQAPGMTFRGALAAIDPFDVRRREVEAHSAPLSIEVRPLPSDAPQPWLPLHDLRLGYLETARSARPGAAATVIVQAQADGASAAQMPELRLGEVDGAQVFAEPPLVRERLVDGRPQTTVQRKFSIVPARGGQLRIAPPPLHWWDARAGQRRVATLPALTLPVLHTAPAAGDWAAPASAVGAPAAPGPARGPVVGPPPVLWAALAALLALLLLATLAWALRRRAPVMASVSAGPGSAPARACAEPAPSLRQALQDGDLGCIADAWRAAARPPAAGLDEVRRRLADPQQLQALEALQQARWGDGDRAAALALLRAALGDGVHWRTAPQAPDPRLPPLYPPPPAVADWDQGEAGR